MDITADFKVELYDAPHSSWVDVTPWIVPNRLEIDLELNSRGSLNVELLENACNGEIDLEPLYSMRVRVRNGLNTMHFGGIVDNALVQYDGMDTLYRRFLVTAQDYSRLLGRFPVNNVFTGMHAGDIVKALISKMPGAESIDTTNVQTGPVISKATFPNLSIQEAIDEVARVAMYKWYIDPEKKMYFFEPRSGALAASWDINTAAINAGRFFGEAPKVSRETTQYRNLQEVKGGTTVDDNWSYFPTLDKPGLAGTYEPGKTNIADIVRKWSLGKPINVISRIVFCPTQNFDESTAEVPFRVSSQQNGGAFFYRQGEPYLYLSEEWQDYAGVTKTIAEYAPRKGQYFWIKYKSETSVSARIEKTDEWCNSEGLAVEDTIYQMAQIEGGSGIYKNVEINDNLKTAKECYERARALLIQHGKVPTTVNYASRNWGDVRPGKYQELSLYGYSGKQCTCTKMVIRDVDGVLLEADFELVGSEKFSGLAYLRGVAGGQTTRMQATYEIRADEIVVNHMGMQETLEVADSLATAKVPFSTAKAWGTARFNDGGIWA